jgi:hypothetical protein
MQTPIDETYDGEWENSQGQNIYPYKGGEKVIQHPMDYSNDEIVREVV